MFGIHFSACLYVGCLRSFNGSLALCVVPCEQCFSQTNSCAFTHICTQDIKGLMLMLPAFHSGSLKRTRKTDEIHITLLKRLAELDVSQLAPFKDNNRSNNADENQQEEVKTELSPYINFMRNDLIDGHELLIQTLPTIFKNNSGYLPIVTRAATTSNQRRNIAVEGNFNNVSLRNHIEIPEFHSLTEEYRLNYQQKQDQKYLGLKTFTVTRRNVKYGTDFLKWNKMTNKEKSYFYSVLTDDVRYYRYHFILNKNNLVIHDKKQEVSYVPLIICGNENEMKLMLKDLNRFANVISALGSLTNIHYEYLHIKAKDNIEQMLVTAARRLNANEITKIVTGLKNMKASFIILKPTTVQALQRAIEINSKQFSAEVSFLFVVLFVLCFGLRCVLVCFLVF